jgi:hypothetical protein
MAVKVPSSSSSSFSSSQTTVRPGWEGASTVVASRCLGTVRTCRKGRERLEDGRLPGVVLSFKRGFEEGEELLGHAGGRGGTVGVEMVGWFGRLKRDQGRKVGEGRGVFGFWGKWR